MQLLDKTYTTQDEEYLAIERIATSIRDELRKLRFDTYNHTYVVKITVDKVEDSDANDSDDQS